MNNKSRFGWTNKIVVFNSSKRKSASVLDSLKCLDESRRLRDKRFVFCWPFRRRTTCDIEQTSKLVEHIILRCYFVERCSVDFSAFFSPFFLSFAITVTIVRSRPRFFFRRRECVETARRVEIVSRVRRKNTFSSSYGQYQLERFDGNPGTRS